MPRNFWTIVECLQWKIEDYEINHVERYADTTIRRFNNWQKAAVYALRIFALGAAGAIDEAIVEWGASSINDCLAIADKLNKLNWQPGDTIAVSFAAGRGLSLKDDHLTTFGEAVLDVIWVYDGLLVANHDEHYQLIIPTLCVNEVQ